MLKILAAAINWYNTACICYDYTQLTTDYLFVIVEVPAIMEDMVLAPMTAAREGTDITLSCLPEMTYPTPNITWLANGTDVQVPTANYTVGPINASSETIYQCLVEATFVPSTNSIGLPPSISFITTTVIDCKRAMCVLCSVYISIRAMCV